jgi:predicted tellurium resistance membrane protein TerC
MFRYLQVGLAAVLIFIGMKMLISGIYHIPVSVSLGIVFSILTTSILTSLRASKKEAALLGEAIGIDMDGDGKTGEAEELSA